MHALGSGWFTAKWNCGTRPAPCSSLRQMHGATYSIASNLATSTGRHEMRSRYSSEATGAVDRFGCRWRRDDDASPWFVTEDDVRIEIPKSWGEVMTRPRMTMGALILLRGPLRLAWNKSI